MPRRYAEWRSLAARRIPAQWLGALAGAILFGLLIALRIYSTFALVCASLALATFTTRMVAGRRLAGLRDEAEDRQFAATLSLQRVTDYGHDEGLVSFEDGFLVYMGRRCTFSFGARDVRLSSVAPDDIQFIFRGPGGRYVGRIQLRKNEVLEKVVSEWQAAGRRSHASVLPPILPNPEFPRLVAVAFGALPLIAVAVMFLRMDPPNPAGRDLPIILAALTLVLAAGSALIHGHELGRITRGERRPLSLLARLRRVRTTRRTMSRKTLESPVEKAAVRDSTTESLKQRIGR